MFHDVHGLSLFSLVISSGFQWVPSNLLSVFEWICLLEEWVLLANRMLIFRVKLKLCVRFLHLFIGFSCVCLYFPFPIFSVVVSVLSFLCFSILCDLCLGLLFVDFHLCSLIVRMYLLIFIWFLWVLLLCVCLFVSFCFTCYCFLRLCLFYVLFNLSWIITDVCMFHDSHQLFQSLHVLHPLC